MPYLMTVEELGNYLRFTRKTIYKLLKEGSLPAIRIGNKWRFDKVAIDDWLQQSMEVSKIRILVVDDDEVIRRLFKDTLEEEGHSVATASTSAEGIECVKMPFLASPGAVPRLSP
jgi:excisionase family DNA binding protein